MWQYEIKKRPTNQHLDKLAAVQADFIARGMLPPDRGPLPGVNTDDYDDGGPIDDEKVMADVQLARTVGTPTLNTSLQ